MVSKFYFSSQLVWKHEIRLSQLVPKVFDFIYTYILVPKGNFSQRWQKMAFEMHNSIIEVKTNISLSLAIKFY